MHTRTKQAPAQRVALVLRYVHQYRIPFLLRLQEQCMQAGVDLNVIYGDPVSGDAAKADSRDFTPGLFVKNRFMKIGNTNLIWQPVIGHLRNSKLVIVEQQTKLLLNYL